MLITADNRDIERSLQKILVSSMKAGAEFRDALVIKCVDGELSVEAPPDSAGKVLMRLPRPCLCPIGGVPLSVVDDNIVMLSHEEGLTREWTPRITGFWGVVCGVRWVDGSFFGPIGGAAGRLWLVLSLHRCVAPLRRRGSPIEPDQPGEGISIVRRLRSSDASWPSASDWERLKQEVGGSLIGAPTGLPG